jgi:hypothetical protein
MSTELQEAAKTAVYELLDRYNGLLNKSQAEQVHKLLHWAEFLAIKKKFTVKQVAWALTELTKNGSPFMPSAIEIANKLEPSKESSEDLAIAAMEEVVKAVVEHGHYRTQRILDSLAPATRAMIGDDHQLLIRIGKSDESELSTIKAQLRNLFRARIESEKAGNHLIQLNRIGITLNNEMRALSYE